MQPTLLILAAGIGKRYGGLKQMDGFGPNGETLIDYSVFDAIRANFGKVVFVIQGNLEEDFKKSFDHRFSHRISLDYAIQDTELELSGGEKIISREKPWGTAHAILSAASKIKTPFAVINADDFYGSAAFGKMSHFLEKVKNNELTYSMVGYHLINTLSDSGHVARGVCKVNDENYLISVTEKTRITEIDGRIYNQENDIKELLPDKSLASMNFWGLTPTIFEFIEEQFKKFLTTNLRSEDAEFYIPTVISNLLRENKVNVKVFESIDHWFGVTYKPDKLKVTEEIMNLINAGKYPEKLWE